VSASVICPVPGAAGHQVEFLACGATILQATSLLVPFAIQNVAVVLARLVHCSYVLKRWCISGLLPQEADSWSAAAFGRAIWLILRQLAHVAVQSGSGLRGLAHGNRAGYLSIMIWACDGGMRSCAAWWPASVHDVQRAWHGDPHVMPASVP
jgi:hypothetical protein